MPNKNTKKKPSRLNLQRKKMVMVAILALAFGAVGTYLVTKSSAAVISGTSSSCGYSYDDYLIRFISYTGKGGSAKNSDSVRNLAKYVCLKGHLSITSALKINSNGNWSTELSKAIKSFELSDARLASNADGIPDAKMICALAEGSYQELGVTYYRYSVPKPYGFLNNDCYFLLGTAKNPNGK